MQRLGMQLIVCCKDDGTPRARSALLGSYSLAMTNRLRLPFNFQQCRQSR